MLKRFLLAAVVALLAGPAAAACPVYADRVQDFSATTGTSDFTLAGTPSSGLQAWSVVGNGNTGDYLATDIQGDWEVGVGTYSSTGPTLARTTVLASSTGSKISFPNGTKTVSLIVPSTFFTGPIQLCSGGLGISTGTSGGVPYFSSTSTVASSALLNGNRLVLGGGAGVAPKTAAGIITDGTSKITLGVSGTSVGGIVLNNGTSGSATIQPPTGALGTPVFTTPNTITSDQLVSLNSPDTLTGKTLTSPALAGTVTGSNTIPLSILAQSGANTMLGNWTGLTANVLANSMPSCSDSGGNHLNYVSGTGITCGTSGGVPSGSAGGDLSGTYPNPTVAKVNAVTYPSGPSANTVPVVTSATSGGTITYEGVPSAALNVTTTTCTNQFVTAISSGGVGTCTTDTLASAQHANQGTTTTVLHGNAAGNPSFGAVANADLTNSSMTIAGHSVSLGGTQTIACADLSDDGTACTASTGTSGATLPFLNGTNTWSGTQTFGAVIGKVTTQAGTTYTLASTDCGTEVTFSSASAVTVTIPATLAIGCNIAVAQIGAGKVSVNGTAVSAATLHSAHSFVATAAQWAIVGVNIEANSGGSSAIAILTGDGS